MPEYKFDKKSYEFSKVVRKTYNFLVAEPGDKLEVTLQRNDLIVYDDIWSPFGGGEDTKFVSMTSSSSKDASTILQAEFNLNFDKGIT